MKKLLAIMILLLSGTGASHAQALGRFYFQEGELQDMGTITASHIALDTFWFENIGDAPIVINFVSTSADFVAADWMREAIKPAHRGFVAYLVKSSKHIGPFNAALFIQSNAKNKPNENIYKLMVKGIIAKDAKPVKKKKAAKPMPK
jgi:Protein of unknown function (DUF1573)